MTDHIWILGAPDPEMERIEALLRAAGEPAAYATISGRRVTPGEAYRADGIVFPTGIPAGWERVDGFECGTGEGSFDPAPTGSMSHIQPWGWLVWLNTNDAWQAGVQLPAAVYRVECAFALRSVTEGCPLGGPNGRTIDHHRVGDPGFGRPPSEFLAASSLGQTVAELARLGRLPAPWQGPGCIGDRDGIGHCPIHADYDGCPPPEWRRITGFEANRACPTGSIGHLGPLGWVVAVEDDEAWTSAQLIPADLVLAAASDHCPGAAYAGKCPGVSPEALMAWRAATRAAFQRRPVEAILADVEATSAAIRATPRVWLSEASDSPPPWCYAPLAEGNSAVVVDMRGRSWPELPEAALRLGVAVLADGLPGPDGRRKVVLMGAGEGTPAGPEPVRAFLGGWAAGQGLVDLYGDPARGFAGAYHPRGADQ